jgi:hypothetical protein
MFRSLLFCSLLCLTTTTIRSQTPGAIDRDKLISIVKTADFDIIGDGANKAWEKTAWINIPARNSSRTSYPTRAKIMYSDKGIYLFYSCDDKKITASLEADFVNLWDEDVVEIFLQPDTTVVDYFEYELSPLNYELPIMIYNRGGQLNSWMPFGYEGKRKTKHATQIIGGEKKSDAEVKGWTAEFFIPFALLEPVMKKMPVKGTIWKGNIYRIDYDKGQALYSWQMTGESFHVPQKFGYFIFE